ncbi:MAG: 26S protease regulatory subunit [Solirubrobacterales bacterium]|nr:26S protease regulatory subunit [Solirubrobacterales bacterium]MBV9801052.1 26S protease regulatory subunit [Solirubrobacterales bacterium]
MAELPDPGAFGAAFVEFMHAMSFVAEHKESAVTVRVREYLGADPKALPTTGAEFPLTEHANLQLAIDAVLSDAEIVGFTTRHSGFGSVGLAEIVAGQGMTGPISLGPVQYTDVEVGDGRVIQCVASALFLTRCAGEAVALVLSRSGDHPMAPSALKLEGVSPKHGVVSELLRELRAAMREHNVFRGRIISLHQHGHHEAVSVRFHAVPAVQRDGVILPSGTLERLERHTVGMTRMTEQLRSAGQHLKRGVLLHGPPGTGKTLSVMYLLHAMAGRTTILLTGRGLGLIEQALAIGRELAPATFVFEDVDLVAAERTMPFHSGGGLLFELLNQMEGLAEDEDLLFLLTTNRPDLIEPALAARPGRIDLALEIPLPDDDGRRRLLALYAKGIPTDQSTQDALVERSAGVSGAFIKELARQAWLRGALENRDAPTGEHLLSVLEELLEERSTLTRRLLGQPGDGAAAAQGEGPFPAMLHALSVAGLPIPPSPSITGDQPGPP